MIDIQDLVFGFPACRGIQLDRDLLLHVLHINGVSHSVLFLCPQVLPPPAPWPAVAPAQGPSQLWHQLPSFAEPAPDIGGDACAAGDYLTATPRSPWPCEEKVECACQTVRIDEETNVQCRRRWIRIRVAGQSANQSLAQLIGGATLILP